MTLNQKLILVDALIKEDPDTTIRDYIETLKDIERVEDTQDQREHLAVLASQGLLFRSHDKMIRTPAERYELPTTERINTKTA